MWELLILAATLPRPRSNTIEILISIFYKTRKTLPKIHDGILSDPHRWLHLHSHDDAVSYPW